MDGTNVFGECVCLCVEVTPLMSMTGVSVWLLSGFCSPFSEQRSLLCFWSQIKHARTTVRILTVSVCCVL